MAQSLTQGGNMAVPAGPVEVVLGWAPERVGGGEVDASAFLLTAAGRVRSDADMVFYNQPADASGAVRLDAARHAFLLDPARLPAEIARVAFVATVHGGSGHFGQASAAWAEVTGLCRYEAGTAGRSEAALILGELYRKDAGWKFRAVGQGFAGGLGPLATHYGVAVDDAPAPAKPVAPMAAPPVSLPPPPPALPPPPPPALPPPPPPASTSPANSSKVRLEKKLVDLEKKDPHLVSLVKKVQVELEKKQLVTDRAKVALCLDISGSMHGLYKSGKLDQLVQRVMALGYRFDDDGEIDVFLFGTNAHTFGTVGVDNYRTLVRDIQARHGLEGGTSYGRVMALLRDHYATQRDFGRLPIYVMFVTDGDTSDQQESERQIRDASSQPFFWQFMAIGKVPQKGPKSGGFFSGLSNMFQSDFGFLEKLDQMPGRVIDNANFFLVEDPSQPSDEELFQRLMAEYPQWLRLAQQQGVLRL